MGKLLVGHFGPGLHRHPDLGNQFAFVQGRIEHSRKKLARLDRAATSSPFNHDGCIGCQHHRGPVGRRVGVGKGATNGAPIAYRGIADMACTFGKHRYVLLHYARGGNVAVRGSGPDHEFVAIDRNTFDFGNPAHIHQSIRGV